MDLAIGVINPLSDCRAGVFGWKGLLLSTPHFIVDEGRFTLIPRFDCGNLAPGIVCSDGFIFASEFRVGGAGKLRICASNACIRTGGFYLDAVAAFVIDG